MKMKYISILIYLLAFNFIQGSLLIPENNSTINYTHVLFEWDQIYQAESNNYQLSDDTSFNEVIANIDNETSLYIHKSDITWDFTYFWRVRAKYSENSLGEWIDTSSFSTGSSSLRVFLTYLLSLYPRKYLPKKFHFGFSIL